MSADRGLIDAERLIWWALAPGRAGGLPWHEEASLSFDHGLSAQPRRKPRGSWALCFAGAAVGTMKRHVVLDAIGDGDAELVLSAIKALPGRQAAAVLHHGRHKTRPAWLDSIVTLKPVYAAPGSPWIAYGDPRRRAQPYCRLDLDLRDDLTDASIARWRIWHAGVAAVAGRLAGTLDRWDVSGFGAPAEPWLKRPPTPQTPSRDPTASPSAGISDFFSDRFGRFTLLADAAE